MATSVANTVENLTIHWSKKMSALLKRSVDLRNLTTSIPRSLLKLLELLVERCSKQAIFTLVYSFEKDGSNRIRFQDLWVEKHWKHRRKCAGVFNLFPHGYTGFTMPLTHLFRQLS